MYAYASVCLLHTHDTKPTTPKPITSPTAGGVYSWAGELCPKAWAPFWSYVTGWANALGAYFWSWSCCCWAVVIGGGWSVEPKHSPTLSLSHTHTYQHHLNKSNTRLSRGHRHFCLFLRPDVQRHAQHRPPGVAGRRLRTLAVRDGFGLRSLVCVSARSRIAHTRPPFQKHPTQPDPPTNQPKFKTNKHNHHPQYHHQSGS